MTRLPGMNEFEKANDIELADIILRSRISVNPGRFKERVNGYIDMTFGEYDKLRKLRISEMLENLVDVTDDGMPMFSGLHPRPPFFKRMWYAIRSIFVRSKFSAEAIEPAEDEVTDTDFNFFNHIKESIDALPDSKEKVKDDR